MLSEQKHVMLWEMSKLQKLNMSKYTAHTQKQKECLTFYLDLTPQRKWDLKR